MPGWRRQDGRLAGQLRPVRIVPRFIRSADGSCLIEMGGTRVVCTASFVQGVPRWRTGSGLGWLTAEYAMLPASTGIRRERRSTNPDGRGVEIQRIIGRVLRNVVRFERLGENTVYLDCDVLEADGGTRVAAITGSCVALAMAVAKAQSAGLCKRGALTGPVAAVSVGLVNDRALLDLDYSEDSTAAVDMNVAMTDDGQFVEIQATGERTGFSEAQLRRLLALARGGIRKLQILQRRAIGKRKRT